MNYDNEVDSKGILNNDKSSFAKQKKSKPLRIKENLYEILMERAFKNKTKISEELDIMFEEAIKY